MKSAIKDSPTRELSADAPAPSGRERLVSLDVFRGMTIAAMILVNSPGGPAYGPLEHAEWNGWTHTDLIFPFFLFIAGASMALSFARRLERGESRRRLERGESRRRLALHAARRGATIFAIGLWLNIFPYFFSAQRYANLRIPGVLQRIGFCYMIGSVIYLATRGAASRAGGEAAEVGERGAGGGDAAELAKSASAGRRWRGAIVTLALGGYWAAMKLIPVPGYGAGDLSATHNLAAYIDNAIFTTRHMWQHRAWDPEGLLSSVPALCTLLIGTFVGEIFVLQSTWQYKVKRLLAWGAAGMVAGEVWNLWFPINKNLWTSSYVVFTAGYAMLLLAACYWAVDVKRWRGWAMPFLVLGMNAILVFTMSTLVTICLLVYRVAEGPKSISAWIWLILHSYRPHFADVRNSSLAFALTYVAIWLAVMWWFYRKKIFVKI